MNISHTDKGFEYLEPPKNGYKELRIQQSSAVGDDGLDNPGNSYLWIGDAHMNREEVKEVMDHLYIWLKTGSLNHKNND